MKNLYMLQVNYAYGKTAHLPYTACTLLAYAMQDNRISSSYAVRDVFFLREEPHKLIDKIVNPGFIGFSSYIWNFEFNKCVARVIKEKYPDCVIVFGGHHINPGSSLLEECPYIDYLIHGEGEEAFKRLLLASEGLDSAEEIPGVSYRKDGIVFTNPSVICNDEFIDYPSPYLNGFFDRILEENKDLVFMALIETTRGCPNCCTYCDWSNMKSRIRKFPIERVKDEIRWISEHHIYGLGAADSNFGCFERDEEITQYIIDMYLKNGFPKGFQTSYAKDSDDRIFRIGLALEKYRLSKGITLSFQSMDEKVLKNIGRHNIPVSFYSHLMDMYNREGVSTYTELILGLPGETFDTFADGIDTLLNLGQHNAIYIHNCEWLPCSVMANEAYTKKFEIGTSRIPLNEPHIECEDDGICEYSNLVTSTVSMTNDDWVKMNLFSFVIQAFHNMGILQFFPIYLHNEKGVSYRSFYERLTEWLLKDERRVPVLSEIREKLKRIASGDETAEFVVTHPCFGKVKWTFEEYIFLCIVQNKEAFYDDVRSFLKEFSIDKSIFEELFAFQKNMLKSPVTGEHEFRFSYNFAEYFRGALKNNSVPLERKNCLVTIPEYSYPDNTEYAKKVVWYGRKDSANTYIHECNFSLKD